jgi:hypothetical protein
MIRLQIAALCFVAGLAIWQAVQGHPVIMPIIFADGQSARHYKKKQGAA